MTRRQALGQKFEEVSLFVFKDHRTEGKVLLELNRQETDRAVAIVGAAFMQKVLIESLEPRLRGDKTAFEKLFNPGKPVGDFGAQVELAYLLELCDKGVRDDLLTIGRVRNWFAHKLDIDSFEISLVRQECMKIKNVLPKRVLGDEPRTTRGRFVWSIATLSGKLREGPEW